MNFLQIVNKVLLRLRQDQVASVNQNDYTSLIAEFVNETKREVEDAWNWNSLTQVQTITTSNGVETYPITGSGDRFTLNWFLDNNQAPLYPLTVQEYYTLTPTDGKPEKYAVFGVDGNMDANLLLYPTPDGIYSFKLNVKIPQPELTSDTDILKVPFMPVVLGAFAKAIGERGEDGGISRAEAQALYEAALRDAIALEAARYPEFTVWNVV